ncbi:MAG TPA: hypothetical protein PKJ19_06740 [Flavobacteriales bacterium]|nr:hypothetical protein [Flavobacteriales bacterium]
MRKAGLWILVLLSALALGVITVALSFPFLTLNDPSGARVAVVEGWIDRSFMPEVRDLLIEGAYDTIYITGTPRNFSYTLRIGDTVVVDLQRPVTGELVVNTCGALNAGLVVLGDEGVILADSVFGPCVDRRAHIDRPTARLRFTPTHLGVPDPRWELVFLLYAKVDGINVHALQRTVRVHRSSGEVEPGTPSYADASAEALVALGVSWSRIRRLPTVMLGESRTWANAQRFAREAEERSIHRVDVISFGIHARRSRLTYSEACGNGVVVGIRSVEDPELRPGLWWRRPMGWLKVLRELAGVPASYLVGTVQ